jgi:hypothetical protein
MGTTGLLSQLGDISNENRLHQRSRTELLGDQDRKQRADQITAALESARTYGTLTPEQQQQALDELHGLYNQPQHMPLLMDAVNRVKGAIRGAIHPNQQQPQQSPAQPNLPVQPTVPTQNPTQPSVESNTPGVNLSQLPLSAVIRPTFGGQPAMAQPAAPPVPQKPMTIGDIIANSYPAGGTFGAQLQKMQKQIELQNAGKRAVAEINSYGKRQPLDAVQLPADAIGPDGQIIPQELRNGPFVQQGYVTDEDENGNVIGRRPIFRKQATRLATTSANGQRLAYDPFTGATLGSYGTSQVPTTSTHEVLGRNNAGKTVTTSLANTRTPVVTGSVPSMPVAVQQPVSQAPATPQAPAATGVGKTLKKSAAPAAPKGGNRVIEDFVPIANLSPEDIQAQAEGIQSGNMAPSQAKGGRGDVGRIQSQAMRGGANLQEAEANYKFNAAQPTQNRLASIDYLTGKDGNGGAFKVVNELSGKINRTSFPPVNSVEFNALLNSGDVDTVRYLGAIKEVADQIGNVFSGGGSTTTDAKMNQAISILNHNFTKAQIDGLIGQGGTLRQLLNERKQSLHKGSVGNTLKSPKSNSLDDEIMKAIGGK